MLVKMTGNCSTCPWSIYHSRHLTNSLKINFVIIQMVSIIVLVVTAEDVVLGVSQVEKGGRKFTKQWLRLNLNSASLSVASDACPSESFPQGGGHDRKASTSPSSDTPPLFVQALPLCQCLFHSYALPYLSIFTVGIPLLFSDLQSHTFFTNSTFFILSI